MEASVEKALPPDSDHPPYIAILADLGQLAAFSATFSERDVDDCCLCICATGVDATTYPFLVDYRTLTEHLQTLVCIQQIHEMKMPYKEYLSKQIRFGSTATHDHMNWEHGRDVPDLTSVGYEQQ